MFAPTYVYGSPVSAPAEWATLPDGKPFHDSRAEFTPCPKCAASGLSALLILSAGGIGNDILDDSNESAISDLGAGWAPYAYVHSGVGTYACIELDGLTPPEVIADMVATAEHFAEYPVLDDSDNSEREWAAWMDAMRDETASLPEDMRAPVAEWVGEHYMGHSDPGHVASEWVTEGVRTLFPHSAPRRVRTSDYGRILALVPAEFDGSEWAELASLPYAGATRVVTQ